MISTTMSQFENTKKSAADRANEIVGGFDAWVSAREAAGDWSDYINQHGKLNRSKIAAEVRFSLSCIRSNGGLKKALAELEVRLASSGLLKASKATQKVVSEATDDLLIQRLLAAKAVAEARSKELEEKLAALKVQLYDQNERLLTYGHLDDHLAATGRLLRR